MIWEDFIASVGFPIAISIYLIVSREKVIKNNTQALTEFKQVIKRCSK